VLQDKNPGEPFEDVCRVLEVSFDGARRDDLMERARLIGLLTVLGSFLL
jgi:hypothetical protein